MSNPNEEVEEAYREWEQSYREINGVQRNEERTNIAKNVIDFVGEVLKHRHSF